MTGSASITSKTWRHESDPLEGEKQGAPQAQWNHLGLLCTPAPFMSMLFAPYAAQDYDK
jgi:hypothetical protein